MTTKWSSYRGVPAHAAGLQKQNKKKWHQIEMLSQGLGSTTHFIPMRRDMPPLFFQRGVLVATFIKDLIFSEFQNGSNTPSLNNVQDVG